MWGWSQSNAYLSTYPLVRMGNMIPTTAGHPAPGAPYLRGPQSLGLAQST